MRNLLAAIFCLWTLTNAEAQFVPAAFAIRPVPAVYFGQTIHRLAVWEPTAPWPSFPVGTLRLWDTPANGPGMNPSRGVYDWSGFDPMVEVAVRNKADIIFVFGHTPRWASSQPASSDYWKAPPANLQDWDDFVRAVVTRAAGRIKYWEIWNEAQETDFYTGTVTQMVELARRAYSIIKTMQPNAQVLTPSVVGGAGPAWMDRYLAAGGGHYADIMAFHGYFDQKPETIVSVIKNLKSIYSKYGLGAKPMWDTEASWGDNAWLVSEDGRAAYVAKQLLLHWSLGVERFVWYAYDNERFGTLWNAATGLAPAGKAYIQVQGWMLGNTLTKPFALNNGVWSGTFTRPDGSQFTVTWMEGSTAMPVMSGAPAPTPTPEPSSKLGGGGGHGKNR